MEEYSIVDALVELRPGAEWSIESRDYNKLTWLDTSQTKPTLDELNVKLTEMNRPSIMCIILFINTIYIILIELSIYTSAKVSYIII